MEQAWIYTGARIGEFRRFLIDSFLFSCQAWQLEWFGAYIPHIQSEVNVIFRLSTSE